MANATRGLALLTLSVIVALLWFTINIREEFEAGTWYLIGAVLVLVVLLGREKIFSMLKV